MLNLKNKHISKQINNKNWEEGREKGWKEVERGARDYKLKSIYNRGKSEKRYQEDMVHFQTCKNCLCFLT